MMDPLSLQQAYGGYGTSGYGYGALMPQSTNPNAALYGLNATTGLMGGLNLTATNAVDPMAGISGLFGLTGQPSMQLQGLQNPLFSLQSLSGDPLQGIAQTLSQIVMMLMQALGSQQYDRGPSVSILDGQLAQVALAALIEKTQEKAGTSTFVLPNSALLRTTAAQNGIAQTAETGESDLNRSLFAIASDQEGAALIEAARGKGITIEVGDPEAAAGANDKVSACDCHTAAQDGTNTVNGVTLTQPDGSIRIVVRDPNNIKTIVHELVHAVSTQDGNSKEEEGIADVIGSRVANRLGGSAVGGLSGTDQEIYVNKQQYYASLNQTNDIRKTLTALGLSVSV